MKAAFSLLEIIIGILIIGLISSFAIPKLMDTKDFANATTLKRDIFSIISSAQSYNLTSPETFNINNAIEINDNIWTVDSEGNLTDKTQCVKISFNTDEITVSQQTETSLVCDKLFKTIFKEDETSKTFIL